MSRLAITLFLALAVIAQGGSIQPLAGSAASSGSTTAAGPAGGDLSGTYPNPQVNSLTLGGSAGAQGAIPLHGASAWGNLAIGSNELFLGSNGTTAAWTAFAGDLNPQSTLGTIFVNNLHFGSDATGDLPLRGATNYGRLAIGSTGQILTVAGGTATWAANAASTLSVGGDLAGSLPNPTVANLHLGSDALGSIPVRGASAYAALAVGATNTALTVVGGTAAWAAIVNSIVAGTDISVSGATGAVTVNFAGMTFQLGGTGGQATTLNIVANGGLTSSQTNVGATETITLTQVPTIVSGGYVTRSSTNLLFAPDKSNTVWSYQSNLWTANTIPDAGITVACTGLSNSTAYFLYVYENSGTLTLDLSTTGTALQNGILVKSGTTSRTLIAYCETNATGAITTHNEVANTQLLCNVYNKRPIQVAKPITVAASWTYQSVTVREADGQTGVNNVIVVMDGNSSITVTKLGAITNGATSVGGEGIGVDATNAQGATGYTSEPSSSSSGSTMATYVGIPAVGLHTYTAVEYCNSATTAVTFFGQSGSGTILAIIYATGLW